MIAHPPCTYLSVARGKPTDDDDAILAALEFFRRLPERQRAIGGRRESGYLQICSGCAGQTIPGCPAVALRGCLRETYLLVAQRAATVIRVLFWLRCRMAPVGAIQWGELQAWSQGTRRASQSQVTEQVHPGMAAAMAKQWGGL